MPVLLAQSDLAMSNDFAAIVSATMAALLLLLIAEFQAGVRSNASVARSLAEEYADTIRASFFEFCSGTELPPEDKKRVERELERYQRLRRVAQRHVVWQYGFVVAGCWLVFGLARVITWAPHAEADLEKGTDVALTALSAIAIGFLLLVLGFVTRFLNAYQFSTLQEGIRLAERYGIPDENDVRSLYRAWEKSRNERPSLTGLLSLATAHLDITRIFRGR
ncbi:hypothetical protein ACFV7Q_34900 [Streptomyces sp. NPDC059851]|uniref:hypothetical protein n=1 Tax=Streptomyces sp. NPDC059851 TaxID=3346971 RepID=UPI0036573578